MRGAAAALAVVLATVGVARADDPAEARRHFEQGTALFGAQAYALALAEFDAAYRAKPHPTVLRNIAAAQEALQRFPEAIRTLERYLRDATGREFSREREAVEAHLAVVRNLVGRLTIDVVPEGSAIRIDGQVVGSGPLAEPVELAYGHHVVEASCDGYDAVREEVDVPPGGQARVELRPIARMARLTVDTNAPHATVAVHGAVPGAAPWSSAIMPGRHRVRVTAPGRRPTEVTVDLAPGAERSLVVQLESGGPQGMIAVGGGLPRGTRAMVDGRPLTPGPDGALAFEQGLHRVVITSPDRVTYSKNVRVRSNRVLNLRPRLAVDRFWVAPIWAVASVVATAALVTGAVYWGLRAIAAADDYQDPQTPTADLPSLYYDHERFSRAANAAIVGTLLFGAGTAFLYYYSRGGAPESTVRLDYAPIR
ncbi:MAG: PEGA domain-containing protein [Deltaproteobacteria bacterium]|nr:PEGA domain-containing protein [Deltaproteobacteria bacterium]